MLVLTVGHSTRSFADLLVMLRCNEVSSLVDVRRYPTSKKFPQWKQANIIEAMPGDIEYRWISELGGRRHTPAGVQSENGAWRVKAFRDYADYMASEGFRTGLAKLLHVAGRSRTAIMCSEALPWRCHRRLITDALLVSGAEVSHIMSATVTKPAKVEPHVRVKDGRITYPLAP